MTKVPKRELSYGELQNKIRQSVRYANKETPGTKSFPTYKYKEPPKNSRHGAVKITRPATLPHPLKCSKCDYIATSVADSHKHWNLEH